MNQKTHYARLLKAGATIEDLEVLNYINNKYQEE